MKERTKLPARERQLAWAIAISMLTLGAAGGAYAAGSAIKQWLFGPFQFQSDGMIRDSDGNVVGGTQQLKDGTTEMTIVLDDVSIVAEGIDLPEGPFSFSFEPSEDVVEQSAFGRKSEEHSSSSE